MFRSMRSSLMRPHTLPALLIAGSTLVFPGFAQDFGRVGPKLLPNAAVNAGDAAEPGAAAGAPFPGANRPTARSSGPIVPSLKGLVFVSSPDAVQSKGVTTQGISFGGIEILQKPGLKEPLAAYLGKPASIVQLNEITRLVVSFYRQHNHPLVDVIVPEQDVQSGVIQVVVTEFRVGEVKAVGNKWFAGNAITAPISLQHGDLINMQRLLGDLDIANANPFRRVNLIYQPSSQPGYTDLVLKTDERFPIRTYGGFDNSGTPVTGRSRWSVGATWGNAFWKDQQLSYQFTSSNDLFGHSSRGPGEPNGASFLSHSLSWSTPLPWRDSLSIFGAYEQSIPNIGTSFGLIGRSGQASIRYVKTLPRTAVFTQSLQAGFDFKTTNNNLDFGGTTVSANTSEIDQFPVIYAATLWDHLGASGATTTAVFSPGGMTGNNSDQSFQPTFGQSGRPFATSNYMYLRQELTRLTKLPGGATWSVRLLGQISNHSLLNTEQLSVGGPDILRGYDPYSILGDQGIVISNELRTPPFHLKRKEDKDFWSHVLDQTQFLTFWDYANLHNRNAGDGVLSSINASSVGVGLRYSLRNYTSLKVDYGWQLRQLPFSNNQGHLLSFGVIFGN